VIDRMANRPQAIASSRVNASVRNEIARQLLTAHGCCSPEEKDMKDQLAYAERGSVS
jgi:hypothetical protein